MHSPKKKSMTEAMFKSANFNPISNLPYTYISHGVTCQVCPARVIPVCRDLSASKA